MGFRLEFMCQCLVVGILMGFLAGNAWAETAPFEDDASLVACDDLAEGPCRDTEQCEWADDRCQYRQARPVDLGVDMAPRPQPEAGPAEAGPTEAGPAEAGPTEAGPREAGPPPEAGMAQADGGGGPSPKSSESSSGCVQVGQSHAVPLLFLALLAGIYRRRHSA